MKIAAEHAAPKAPAIFLPKDESPAREKLLAPIAGYLKWFAEAPDEKPAHTQARRLIAREFSRHMASLEKGEAADFGDRLVESLSGILHTDLRHRLTFNVKLCARYRVGPFEAHTLAFVLSEIVLNALKHARPDEGRIVIEIDCLPGPDGETQLCVSDDGHGLPPGFMEWADAGEGLSRIRYVLEQIGANLNLESDDLGLRCQIELPAPDAQKASALALPKVLSTYSAHYLAEGDNPHAYPPD